MTAFLDLIPTLVLVWMIGFSGDRLWIRRGAFLVLAVEWLAPLVVYAATKGEGVYQMANSSTIAMLASSLLLGGYLILWAVCSSQTVVARLALAATGLLALRTVIVMGGLVLAMG
jgi:hypothetical protein